MPPPPRLLWLFRQADLATRLPGYLFTVPARAKSLPRKEATCSGQEVKIILAPHPGAQEHFPTPHKEAEARVPHAALPHFPDLEKQRSGTLLRPGQLVSWGEEGKRRRGTGKKPGGALAPEPLMPPLEARLFGGGRSQVDSVPGKASQEGFRGPRSGDPSM